MDDDDPMMSRRIRRLRALVGLSGGPAEFCRQHPDIDASYVSQILNGHRAFRDRASLNMARRAGLPDRYFEEDENRLVNHVTTIEEAPPTPYFSAIPELKATIQHVPIFTWETCLMARDNYDNFKSTAPIYPIGESIDGRLFALTQPDDSMQGGPGNGFPPGTTLIFDLDIAPAHLDYVLFKGPDGRAHCRQYVIDVGRRRLHPLNPRFEPLPAPADRAAYLGVLVRAIPPAIYHRPG